MRRLRNITITLDEAVARWARIEAARQDTSVSQLLARILHEPVAGPRPLSSTDPGGSCLSAGGEPRLSAGGLLSRPARCCSGQDFPEPTALSMQAATRTEKRHRLMAYGDRCRPPGRTTCLRPRISFALLFRLARVEDNGEVGALLLARSSPKSSERSPVDRIFPESPPFFARGSCLPALLMSSFSSSL